ncbi:hypothetical protein GQ43DRAFT_449775 [Delitschia confertaspora ATCC 74209]|uniref:Ribonuclease P/MRP protein subunit POP5 n=1 Tax=Delitschia confertaspora ATCC 74209 TaxID=1513339 RepID=A0A9P4JJ24_9PLEO|nr:hypothetical protein GQ43DRAFT_449775 [Delitschia confertaspora ATCC 74209]
MVRVKHRYLVVNFLYPTATTNASSKGPVPEFIQFHHPTSDQLTHGLLLKSIRDGVSELFGDYGAGVVSTGLKINYLSTATSTMIIRCPRSHYQLVWAALTFMTKLPKPINQPVVVKIVRVSGTIRKAEEEVIRRAQAIIDRAKTAQGSNRDTDPVVGNIVKAAIRRKEANVLVEIDEGSESEASEE